MEKEEGRGEERGVWYCNTDIASWMVAMLYLVLCITGQEGTDVEAERCLGS